MMGHNRRARLVVLGVEVGGRWSQEMQHFVSQLARAKARGETNLMRRRVEQAWRLRWGSILACAVARTVSCQVRVVPTVTLLPHRMLSRMAGSPVWLSERL